MNSGGDNFWIWLLAAILALMAIVLVAAKADGISVKALLIYAWEELKEVWRRPWHRS